ncbi:hypothetical protein ACFXPW_29455, partial [Streptomyces goshikiensis]
MPTPPPSALPPTTAPASAPADAAALSASAEYLAAADEAGLLHRSEGLVYVAGAYREPLTGVEQCLVEHADPRLLRAAPAFLDALFARFPECTEAIVRVPGADDPHPVLTRHLSYLALPAAAGSAPPGAPAPGGSVAPGADRAPDPPGP